MSSDPGPASNGFSQPPSTPPTEPAPNTQPLPSTRPIPPVPPAPPPTPPLPPTVREPAAAPAAPPGPSRPPAPSRAGYGPPSYGVVPYGPQHGPYPYGSAGRYVQPGMLAASADRERTMDVVKAAFTEGRLTKGEFEERTARVLGARTYAELHALVADLPAGPSGPAAPYHAGYYQPLVVRKTNGFAVGSLVCGIFPVFCGIPAVILGHAARKQIQKSGERGDGMAVAGLILGYLWLSALVLIILLSIAHGGGGAAPHP